MRFHLYSVEDALFAGMAVHTFQEFINIPYFQKKSELLLRVLYYEIFISENDLFPGRFGGMTGFFVFSHFQIITYL